MKRLGLLVSILGLASLFILFFNFAPTLFSHTRPITPAYAQLDTGGAAGGITGSASDGSTGASGADVGPAAGTAFNGKGLAAYIGDPNGFVYKSWRDSRAIINILLIIALLIISFSNITRVNLDNYTVKKALPNLVLGVILANASFLIIRYIADIVTVVTYLFVEMGIGPNETFAHFLTAATKTIGIEAFKNLGWVTVSSAIKPITMLVIFLLGIVTVVAFLWLAFLLYFRLVVIYLLTILAPLAFIAYGLPGLDQYFKKWWQQFIKWVFILPAMAAVFWLMIKIGQASSDTGFAKILIMYVLFYTALTIPTKFGGQVVAKASGAFMKYTGTNAAIQGAKTQGELLARKAPGIGHVMAANEILKEKQQQAMENVKKRRRGDVMRTFVGRGYFRQKVKGDVYQNRLAAAESIAGRRAIEDPRILGVKIGKNGLEQEVFLSEIAKDSAERRKNITGKRKRMDLRKEKDPNTDRGRYEAVLREREQLGVEDDGLGARLDLAGKLDRGAVVNQIHVMSQNAADWKRKENQKKLAKPEELERLTAEQNDLSAAFDLWKNRDEYKGEYGHLTIKDLADKIDKPKTTADETLAGQHRITSKEFTDGINGQNEQDLASATAAEVIAKLDSYNQKLTDDFGTELGTRIRTAFTQGNTALMARLMIEEMNQKGWKDKDGKDVATSDIYSRIRDGILASELNKSIMAKTGDQRNTEVLAAAIERLSKDGGIRTHDNVGNDVTNDLISRLQSGQVKNQQERRDIIRNVTESGMFAGSPASRYQSALKPTEVRLVGVDNKTATKLGEKIGGGVADNVPNPSTQAPPPTSPQTPPPTANPTTTNSTPTGQTIVAPPYPANANINPSSNPPPTPNQEDDDEEDEEAGPTTETE